MAEIKLDAHYVDPRLVELYDIENPRGEDTDFYLQLAETLAAKTIIDLGCGTGLLTRELALSGQKSGRKVIGIDPAAEMLNHARKQPDADTVEWINGSAADLSHLGNKSADLVIMTGNVAQVFLDEVEWSATLSAIHSALKKGGCLAFESRNPAAKAWENWTPEKTFQRLDSPSGPLESWLEVTKIGDRTIDFKGVNRFVDSAEDVVIDSRLRFRSRAELIGCLQRAGFSVKHTYGNWQSEPMEPLSPTMVFVTVCQ